MAFLGSALRLTAWWFDIAGAGWAFRLWLLGVNVLGRRRASFPPYFGFMPPRAQDI